MLCNDLQISSKLEGKWGGCDSAVIKKVYDESIYRLLTNCIVP